MANVAKAPLTAEVSIGLSTMAASDRGRLEARLAKAARACGCEAGAAALLIAMVASVAWWILHREGRFFLWPEAGVAVLGILAAALAGKAAGILFARTWRALAIRRLRWRARRTAHV